MKKYILFLFSVVFMTMASTVNAQNEGHITFEITDVTSDNPQVAAQMEMMKGSVTEVYYKGDQSLTNMNMMGGMININIIVEGKDQGSKMAMDMMGQKMLIPISKAEMDKAKAESDNPLAELDIQYDENDTKQIAGLDCYKVVATSIANPDMKIEAYITDAITTKAGFIQGLEMDQFKGYPLEITASLGMVDMTYTAQAFEPKCDDTSLTLDTSGFTEMTFEEFMNSMGQMGGGFGF